MLSLFNPPPPLPPEERPFFTLASKQAVFSLCGSSGRYKPADRVCVHPVSTWASSLTLNRFSWTKWILKNFTFFVCPFFFLLASAFNQAPFRRCGSSGRWERADRVYTCPWAPERLESTQPSRVNQNWAKAQKIKKKYKYFTTYSYSYLITRLLYLVPALSAFIMLVCFIYTFLSPPIFRPIKERNFPNTFSARMWNQKKKNSKRTKRIDFALIETRCESVLTFSVI